MFNDKYNIDWENQQNDDVEPEQEETTLEDHEKPFNVEMIRVEMKPISVYQMKEAIDSGQLNLSPDFQRRQVWKEIDRKSLLIESLMLRIPLPVFYVYEDEDAVWHVVDGLQRMSTIHDFMKDKFPLKGLQYLKHLDGMKFSQLVGPDYQKYSTRITRTTLMINVIDATTPGQVKFDIFRRINTGGVPLNAQEIRNSVARVQTREFLKELVDSSEFKAATNNMNDMRMQAQELVLRFFAFYKIYDFENAQIFYKKRLETMLDEMADHLNKATESQLKEYKEIFLNGLRNAHLLFGEYAFRRVLLPHRKRNPINKSLFTCMSVILSHYDHEWLDRWEWGNYAVDYLAEMFDNDIEFSDSFSNWTGDPVRIAVQFKTVRAIIDEVISDDE